jgi:hypothetical protein
VYQSLIEIVHSRTARAKSLQKSKKNKNGIDINLMTENILSRLGEPNVTTFFKENISVVPLKILELPKGAEAAEIEKTLFGWQLKVGKKNIIPCESEAYARYLRVFIEMGWDHAPVCEDEKYLASIVHEFERHFANAISALQEFSASILQYKIRERLKHSFWVKLREIMEG